MSKFCSIRCKQDYGRITRECKHCKKEFTFAKNRNLTFCSLSCASAFRSDRGGKVKVKCPNCESLFIVKRHKLKNDNVFCTHKCYTEYHLGKNHWNWNGGISRKNHRRETKEYKEWRLAVYKKDYWTCQDCNVKQKHPIAHHKKTWNDYPELRYDVNNGVTLCRSCHKKRHTEIGYNTRFKPLTVTYQVVLS